MNHLHLRRFLCAIGLHRWGAWTYVGYHDYQRGCEFCGWQQTRQFGATWHP